MSVILPTVSTVKHPIGWGYDAHLNDLLLRLAVSSSDDLQRITAEATPPKIDTAASDQDIRDETGYRYSRTVLHGGAGLDFLHDVDRPADADIRFWSSRGIDVFTRQDGTPYAARLLHDTETDQSSSASSIWTAVVNDIAYWSDGSDIYIAGSSTSQLSITHSKMVAMGNSLYTLSSSGITEIPVTGFTTTVIDSTATYDDMWAAKSRILALDGNILYQTDATTPLPVLTLPPNDIVTDVIDAEEYVLVLASTGSIHVLTLDENLDLGKTAESPFLGEVPLLGTFSQGVLGIATNEAITSGNILRFYSANLGNGGVPSNMALQFQIGDEFTSTYNTLYAMTADRDSIYIAAKSDLNSQLVQLWRFYLPTMGYARDLEFEAAGASVSSMCSASGRLYVAINGQGLFREAVEYVSSGYFIGPAANFATADVKQWVSSSISAIDIPAGCSIEVYESTQIEDLNDPDSSTWMYVASLFSGALEKEQTVTPAGDAVYHLTKVVLNAGTVAEDTPLFRAVSFRALPTPDRDILIRIPVNVSDQYESPGKRARTVHGRGQAILDAILQNEGRAVSFGIYRTNFEFDGVLERTELDETTLPARGSLSNVIYLLIRGKQTQANVGYGVRTQGAGWGIDPWAGPMFAVGEVNT